MKFLTVSVLALAMIAGAANAYAGNEGEGCHSISDSVYGMWGCR